MVFNAQTVSLLTDVPFLALHVSMIIFLLRQRRKDSSLRNTFFTLYIVVSIGGVMANGATVFFIYAVSSGFFTDVFLACEICPKLQIECCTYGRMAEALGHTAIALNRFSCFYADEFHSRIWSGRSGTIVCAAVAILPLLKLSLHMPRQAVYLPSYVTGAYAVQYSDAQWVRTFLTIDGMIHAVCTAVSLAASLGAVYQLYRLRASQQRSVSHPDLRLFAYSLVMFVLQLLMTFMYLTFGQFITWPPIVAIVRPTARYFVDAYSLSGPVFLLLLSASVRSKYLQFYHLTSKPTTASSSTPVRFTVALNVVNVTTVSGRK